MSQSPQSTIEAITGEYLSLAELSAGLGHTALASEATPKDVAAGILPGLEGTAKEAVSVLDGKAALIVDADVTGPWHYSDQKIDTFYRKKAEQTSGKFGHGTYLGIGDLRGETADGLKSGGYVKHDIRFRGNVLALERNDVLNVTRNLKELNGLPVSKVRSKVQTAEITDLVEKVRIGERQVDAVMIYMDPERQTAELVVLPGAAESISVIGTS